LLSASLLLWHFGYASGREPIVTWTIGFACAALAALVKGPQAPVYFVAITAVYLAVRRDWRWLVCWEYAAGAAVFAIIVAAWQIPFYLATDWPTVVATWSGLAGDRFHLGGMAQHFVTYPLETFACLLPWSPLLVALAKRETRVLLSDARPVVSFLVIALLVAYPSVWMAAGARGRYFMPLYPLVAVLIGLIIERCSAACVVGYPRRAWRQFMLLSSVLIGGGGALFGISGLLPGDSANWMHQPRWFGIMLGIAAIVCVYVIWRCFRAADRIATIGVVLTVALFVGIAYAGVMINVNSARWTDPTQLVREMKHIVPADVPLVSLTPIEHRFAYYFREPIAELDWPRDARELPDHVQYFCFMRNPGDTAERRAAGRGRSWTYTPGTLPFAWEELASFCVDRRVPEGEKRMVVIGRVFRPLRAGVYDATVPQQATARQSQDVQRR
jgi:4-amino-4-deoxy-L-arabinose transferase-like glycosyltransferase